MNDKGNGLTRVSVDEVPPECGFIWAESMSFHIPSSTLHRAGLARFLDREGRLRLPSGFRVQETGDDATALRLRRAYTEQAPVSSRLPFSYRRVPAWLRTQLATALGRWKRHTTDTWAAFPAWPLDLSADFVADLQGREPSPFMSGPTPVLLTHDLDSAEGLENLVGHFLELEEAVGARSTNFIVPFAWPLEFGLLDEVVARGHLLGIHGHDHSNRTPFVSAAERKNRLHAARPLIERYGIDGYRAPSLVRTKALLESLAEYYQYDSSIPTSGGLFPVPNNGCASARPFRVGGLIEIPLSLPRDGSLRFLGHTPTEILSLWIDCAERISRSGGVVVLLTHCERRFSGNADMLLAYRELLDFLNSSGRFSWSTPAEICHACAPSPR